MRRYRGYGLLFVPLLFTTLVLAGDPANPAALTVDELIANLGDPVYAVREKAQLELWNRGDAAIPALEAALRNEKPEVVRRAGELLEKFAWGIRANSPPEVVKLLRQFQAGDPDPQKSRQTRRDAIAGLAKSGHAGVAVVRGILTRKLPLDVHAEVVTQITALVRREVPLRLYDGNTEAAAELVALHLSGTGPEGAGDYAAFEMLRGKLPEAIAAAQKTATSPNGKLILAHLYRARGDWARAREAATDLPDKPGAPSLIESLREEEGDWATLADTVQTGNANHPDAVRLTLLRLAGRNKELEEEVARVVKQAGEATTAEEVADAAIALFSNHRVEDGTRILLDRKLNLGLLAETLIARLRYKEALAITLGEGTVSEAEKLAFDLRRARLLMLTGQRDEAVKLFGQVAAGLRPEQAPDRQVRSIRTLLRTEMRVGLKDLADTHAAAFLVGAYGAFDGASGESAFELLFGQDATAAATLFSALREKKVLDGAPGLTIAHIRQLLTGKANKSIVDETLKLLRSGDWGVPLTTTSQGSENQPGYPVRALPGHCGGLPRGQSARGRGRSLS